MKKPIRLIFDTDIGSDIDDSWALVMALKSPEVDIKLVTVNGYNTEFQAKVTAKMLDAAGRSDIPIAIGRTAPEEGPDVIADWVADYDLKSYPNIVGNEGDAGRAIVDCINESEEETVILAIGCFRNLEDAYKLDPSITKKSRLVLIAGNIFNHAFPGWHPGLASEWNIRHDLNAWRVGVEETDWKADLIPLDVSGNIRLSEPYFVKVREQAEHDPALKALIDSNDVWFKAENWNTSGETSPLFDTVGVYSLITHDNFIMERLPVYSNDASITLIDPERGKMMDVATDWIDKEKFYKFLVARLCGEI